MPLQIGKHKLSNRDIIKESLGFIFGISVGFVVKQIIENNTEPENRIQDAEKYLGAMALGMVAKEAVRDSIDKKVDKVCDAFKSAQIDVELKKITEEANGEVE